MPWDARGRVRYFYRSVRVGGRPTRRYLGRGPAAASAAAAVERRRADRADRAAALEGEARRHANAMSALDELCEAADLLLRAALLAQGYHQHHRGVWRRRRHGPRGREAGDREGLPG